MTWIFHPFNSAYFVYIRYKSDAKIFASSPPAAPRISTITFFSSFGSLGINKISKRSSNSGRRGFNSSNSISAISLISGSESFAISFKSSIEAAISLYSVYTLTVSSRPRCSFDNSVNFLISVTIAGSAIISLIFS